MEWTLPRKIQMHISLGQDATAFQAEVAAILNCVTSCLGKRWMKEQITICTDSQVAVAALAASWWKSLLVADCIEKVVTLLNENQVIIMWALGHSGIQQKETDRLVRKGARTRPVGPEPFLLLSFSRFKSKIRNWIGKRKQTEWRVCKRYETSYYGPYAKNFLKNSLTARNLNDKVKL